MVPVTQEVWQLLRRRLFGPFPLGAEKDGFTTAVMKSFIDCKDVVARTCGVPADSLRYFCSKEEVQAEGSGYLLDFAWTTYPTDRTFDYRLDSLCSASKYGILLAAESEVGQSCEKEPKRAYKKVLEDFVKLVDVRSPIKVMVYRVPCNMETEGFARIHRGFEQILQCHRAFDPGESWLFVEVPWYCKRKWPPFEESNVRVRVLSEHPQDGLKLCSPTWPL